MPLARAVTWLAFWDMTRDGEFPAERFVDMTLRLLATETESTTFRYALACMGTTAHHYVAPARRDDVLRHVAAELWTLANAAAAGSDTQFQLATAYLGYGEEGDAAFAANAHGLLDGTVRLEGLEIDNNFTWTIVQALTSVNEMTNDDVDAQLAKKETTENREFAYGARASMATTPSQGMGLGSGTPQRRADQLPARSRGPWLLRHPAPRSGRAVRRQVLRDCGLGLGQQDLSHGRGFAQRPVPGLRRSRHAGQAR